MYFWEGLVDAISPLDIFRIMSKVNIGGSSSIPWGELMALTKDGIFLSLIFEICLWSMDASSNREYFFVFTGLSREWEDCDEENDCMEICGSVEGLISS